MKPTAEEILIDIYGCKDRDDLQNCFLNENISLAMIKNAMEAYAEAVTKDMYPKEFVEWYVTEGQFKLSLIGTVPNPLDEAFNYWKQNIEK